MAATLATLATLAKLANDASVTGGRGVAPPASPAALRRAGGTIRSGGGACAEGRGASRPGPRRSAGRYMYAQEDKYAQGEKGVDACPDGTSPAPCDSVAGPVRRGCLSPPSEKGSRASDAGRAISSGDPQQDGSVDSRWSFELAFKRPSTVDRPRLEARACGGGEGERKGKERKGREVV